MGTFRRGSVRDISHWLADPLLLSYFTFVVGLNLIRFEVRFGFWRFGSRALVRILRILVQNFFY